MYAERYLTKVKGKFIIKVTIITSGEDNQIKFKYTDSSKSVFNYENIELAF